MPLLTLLLFACLPEKQPESTATRDARWTALEAQLRQELGAAYDQPVASLAQADLKNGRTIYQKSCVACHGAELDGKGGRASTLVPAPSALVGPGSDRFSDAGQLHLLNRGVPGTAMAAWGDRFGGDQVRDVYAYVLQQRQNH
jgi:mono/diheme cytochrome c family protein